MLRTAFAAGLLLLGTACAQLPRAELQAYRDSFAAAQSAAEPLLTDYAISERAARLARLEAETDFARSGYFAVFDPADAAAVSTLSPPPGAAALQRAFGGLAGYNDTLVALAENRNIDEARAQLRETIANLTGITAGVAPQAAAAEAPIQAATGFLVTLLSPAIEIDNRRQFTRIVLSGYPRIRELIAELRNYTPTQYSITTRALRARWVREEQNRPQIAAEINTWHHAYADYVALLNALEANLTVLHEAVENPRAVPLLARASSGSSELRAYAMALRQSIAEIRAPR
jgi:hypothetical protein